MGVGLIEPLDNVEGGEGLESGTAGFPDLCDDSIELQHETVLANVDVHRRLSTSGGLLGSQ